MTLRLRNIEFPTSLEALRLQQEGLVLINTINAHSYNLARKDAAFAEALLRSDVLLPDGASVVWAKKRLFRTKNKEQKAKNKELKRIAGWDLFVWEMERLESRAKNKEPRDVETRHATSVLFLGSTEAVLAKIKARAAVEYPNVEVHTYSPPYKPEFSDEDNAAMLEIINSVNPDVLFVGMTAPKQEKWAYQLVNSNQFIVYREENDYKLSTINYKPNCHVCCIGAVFDFYAGTVKRAPLWWQRNSLEWLYRLIKEPRRMWRRYLVGNVRFVWYVLGELVYCK